VEAAARAALAGRGDDPVERLRVEVVFGAARIIDGDKPYLVKQAAEILRTYLIDLVGHAEPKGGEADALRDLVETLRSPD
jgi:hypothetical protein